MEIPRTSFESAHRQLSPFVAIVVHTTRDYLGRSFAGINLDDGAMLFRLTPIRRSSKTRVHLTAGARARHLACHACKPQKEGLKCGQFAVAFMFHCTAY